jgi:hypothetical protein
LTGQKLVKQTAAGAQASTIKKAFSYLSVPSEGSTNIAIQRISDLSHNLPDGLLIYIDRRGEPLTVKGGLYERKYPWPEPASV